MMYVASLLGCSGHRTSSAYTRPAVTIKVIAILRIVVCEPKVYLARELSIHDLQFTLQKASRPPYH